ncbi:hypothetical protein SUGI_0067540 [Cryptomeria japonica]|uniref:uncharacterized protein LOC131060204 n=1 Tax=Cryptomeria japonica TaxID=3369 RepID=UPI002408C586|nr:uncharacterized protein LOC131060204 [Cryptomeria japonica]GLJ07458.1 hypothetical protein SUGI_0067540 [Cryptomeria japonica]
MSQHQRTDVPNGDPPRLQVEIKVVEVTLDGWRPNPQQMEILQEFYNQGSANLGRNYMQITNELKAYGPAEELNVVHWFIWRRGSQFALVTDPEDGTTMRVPISIGAQTPE